MSNLRRDARCLIRQREPIRYWQLCFPTRFNELHKVARHASRRPFRFLSKPVAPICERGHYKRTEPSAVAPGKRHIRAHLAELRPGATALGSVIIHTSVASHVARTP